jgi:hypothetical protein
MAGRPEPRSKPLRRARKHTRTHHPRKPPGTVAVRSASMPGAVQQSSEVPMPRDGAVAQHEAPTQPRTAEPAQQARMEPSRIQRSVREASGCSEVAEAVGPPPYRLPPRRPRAPSGRLSSEQQRGIDGIGGGSHHPSNHRRASGSRRRQSRSWWPPPGSRTRRTSCSAYPSPLRWAQKAHTEPA